MRNTPTFRPLTILVLSLTAALLAGCGAPADPDAPEQQKIDMETVRTQVQGAIFQLPPSQESYLLYLTSNLVIDAVKDGAAKVEELTQLSEKVETAQTAVSEKVDQVEETVEKAQTCLEDVVDCLKQ